MNLSAPHWELASLGRGTTTTTKRVLFRCFRIRLSSIHATSSRASRTATAAGVVALNRKWRTTPGTETATAAASEKKGTVKPTKDTRWCKKCKWRGRRKKRKRRWWIITNGLRYRCCCRRQENSLPVLSSSPQPPQQPRLSQSLPSRSAVVRWSRGTSKGPANPGRSDRHLGDWSGIRTSGADIIEQRGYPGEWLLADRATGWTTTQIIVARVCPLPRRRGAQTKRETKTRGEYVETRSPVQEDVDVYRCTVQRKSEENLARITEWRKNKPSKRSRLNGAQHCRVSVDASEITIASAAVTSLVTQRTAFRKHKESSIRKQSTCREAGLRFGGSDAGPSAAVRLRHGSSTQRVHHESSFLSSAGVRDIEEKEAAATKRSVSFGGGRRSTSHCATNVRVKKRRRGGARRRRQDVGDVSVPDYLVAPMRFDPFGLTGPSTSKKWQERKKREQKKEKEQQLRLSSSSSLSSIVECVQSDCAVCRSYTLSKSFPKSIRNRVVDDDGVFAAQHYHEARYYEAGSEPDEKAGTATAFRISRDSVSRGEVRARTRDRHEVHEDENDNDSDALRARTILRTNRPLLRRRWVSRFVRRARRRSRRRRGNGAISDAATSIVSFVDVHAYTAYSDDRDNDGENDDDDDDDNEGQTHCERKRTHGESEETYDEYKEDKNDDNARVSVSNNSRDKYEHENANENALREDYIRTKMDSSNRGVSKSDQWALQSSLFDGKKKRADGCVEYPTVGEVFNGQARRKRGRYSERRRTDNTAWFQKPITKRKGRGGEGEGRGIWHKPRIRRSYYRLLLFVLYLLAWPLLCSSSPSGHFASTFAQNPTLAHAKNPAQRGNTTPPDTSLFSSSTVIEHQYQHSQQYVQGSDHNTDSESHRHHQQQQQKEEQMEQSDQEESEQRHPYNEYTWEVNQMNPWLSACDLAGPAPTDLQGSCGAPPVEVPKYCPKLCKNASEIMKTYNMKINRGVGGESDEKKEEKEQCLLYLEESHKKIICQTGGGEKKNNLSDLLRRLRLRHCCEHAVFNALAPGKGGPLENVLKGDNECNNALGKLLLVDALAARLHCEFEEVLARYDCAQQYSVIHNCTHCKEAYRKWVCSSLVPYFAHRSPKDVGSWTGPRLRPCRSFCQTVEQRCPYFLPGDRAPAYPTQYAGEPTFLCRDPKILETGEQAARTLHSISDDECCFHVCSEDTKEGICTKCKEPWKNGKVHDPATAPQCEMDLPQFGSTGPGSQAGQPETSTDHKLTDGGGQDTSIAPFSSTTPSTTTVGQKDTAFCGSGRIGSISSASSPGRPSPPIALQLFWLCSILITLPANALQYNAVSWSPSGFFRLIGSSLLFSSAFILKRVFNDLRVSFGPLSTGIYRLAVVRCLLFVLGMPGRAVMKCRRRGWWWWRSWRRSSSRHFRWKFLRRFGVASQWFILRESIAILELFLKFAAKCRCRDWWWLWRRWRKCRWTGGQKLVPRRKYPATHGTVRRRRGRRRNLSKVLRMDVDSSAKSISRKDPP